MGHGARGLQPRRHRVGLPHPRPGAQPRLPLGRGRHRRLFRRSAAAVPVARAVERARSDPQGAAVRADERGGQPRRGRQGAVLLSRCGAELRLRAHALQAAAGGLSVRMADRGERPPPRLGGDGVRADRYRHFRRRPLLRHRGRVCQGGRGRRAHADHGPQPRPRAGLHPCPAAGLVPQHLELVGRHAEAVVAGSGQRRRARAARPAGAL